MSDAALALTTLAGRRGGRMLFEGLDLALGPGEAALVTGANGAGKSSLLRIIAGLLAPAAGTVRTRGRIGWLGEATALDPRLTLRDALAFWARIDRRGRGEVAAALDRMGIARLAPVPVRMLSTGQRRRAAIARVIASGADLWLLDEPGSGLDEAALAALAETIAEHRARGGIVVAATHQPLAIDRAAAVRLGP
jgi:heme exporter protein A